MVTQLVDLKCQVTAKDAAAAMRLAHQIKGASGQIGAERAAHIAGLIEADSKKGILSGETVARLDSSLKESAAALEDLFAHAEAP